MVTERLKFYADTQKAKNQFFCWNINSILQLKETLWRFFEKGWNIRAAWYEKIDTETGETENQRLNVQELFDDYIRANFAPNGNWVELKGHIKRSY